MVSNAHFFFFFQITPGQPVKKFSSDNALMVGVVRQNRYKGKEAVDGAKNDQLVTLSKGWINFYTLRADSLDTDLHGNDSIIQLISAVTSKI